MADTGKRLDTRGIGTSLTTHYTVPGSTRTRVTEIWLCNTTTAPITVRVHVVPSGGSADTSNAFLYDAIIEPNDPYPLPMNTWMNTGDFIRMSASATGVAATISGVEIT